MGKITKRHIDKIKDITNAVNRGIKGSSCIYTAVKNKTFEEIKITTDIKVIPFISSRMFRESGEEGELKKSQVRRRALFSRKRYIKVGIKNRREDIKENPALIGCHITYRKNRE